MSHVQRIFIQTERGKLDTPRAHSQTENATARENDLPAKRGEHPPAENPKINVPLPPSKRSAGFPESQTNSALAVCKYTFK
jgi:hypothetical protein